MGNKYHMSLTIYLILQFNLNKWMWAKFTNFHWSTKG